MNRNIRKILKPYQITHVNNLTERLLEKHICFDTSDTGTGKTYSAIATAKHIKMDVFIICPKTIMSLWIRIAKVFDVELIGISNYESLIRLKYFDKKKTSKICPYIKKTQDAEIVYKWELPKNTMIIFDEVHKCCNPNAYIGQLLLSLKNVYSDENPLLLISATICDGPAKFRLFGVLLKWFHYCNNAFNWLDSKYNPIAASKLIHQRLEAGNNICKVKISDLGEQFAKNQVSAEYYDIKKTDANAIDQLHKKIIKSMEDITNKGENDKKCGFTIGIRERQKIELLKVQIFVELTSEYLENDFSVIIFVNFTESLKLLASELKTECVIYGEQSLDQRLKNIDDFTNDKKRVIICNIHTGGDSISLNDKHGKYKRISLISPPLSAIKLIQACGRNSRIDSKTNSFNQIIYADTKIERKLCNRLKDKCTMYSTITQEDLQYDLE
jgi:superfamily II DNA or RNA helicase